MRRMLFCCAALAAFPCAARAGETLTSTNFIIQLTVQPMPESKPALRYLLLPELKEMHPGNPVAMYLRCMLERDAAGKESFGPLALRQADQAARLDKPDWQILEKAKTDGVGLLLPDVQVMRALAPDLQARFRTEYSRGQYDDALETAKTMFALSRHMSEHPTLIGDLVGIAIAIATLTPLQEMLEQPDCPNLYWALTNLPDPLIPVTKGMAGERMLIRGEMKDLDEHDSMTPEQIKRVLDHIDKLRSQPNIPLKPAERTRALLDKRVKDEGTVRAARRRLVTYGLVEGQVAKFPADQVMLLDARREYETQRDEQMKLMNLPYWKIEQALARSEPKPAKEKSLFDFFLPAGMKVRQAQDRLQQRIALLRQVEALRMYAADHNGQLPEKLSDISVPLPDDPFTGKPFRYERDGSTARIFGSPPKGAEKNPILNVRVELTIRK